MRLQSITFAIIFNAFLGVHCHSIRTQKFVNLWPFRLNWRDASSKPWSELDTSGSGTGTKLVPFKWTPYSWAKPAPKDKVVHIKRMVERQGTGGCNIVCPRPFGVYRHPNDCSKFYNCQGSDGNVAYVSTCMYPLLFNEVKGVCDWPESVACPNPPFNFRHVCGRPFGLFAHPLDCRIYFNCWGGFPRIEACPTGLFFSASRQKCDFPHLSNCQLIGQTPEVKPEPLPEIGLPPGVSFQCPTPDNLFPLQEDCTRYFQCKNGRPSLKKCPDNQLFETWYVGPILQGRCLDFFRVTRTCKVTPTVSICGFVNGMKGTIASPNYPSNYNANLNCNYIINRAREDVCKVQMTFEDFEMESSGDCTNDFLQIQDRQFCGMMLPKGQRITLEFPQRTPEIRMRLRTNTFQERRGFKIRVEQLTDCSIGLPEAKTLPPPPSCDYNIPNVIGNISSLFYPRPYLDLLGCTYRFTRRSKNVCFLRLKFLNFNLEESVNCIADYLEVADKRYCGSWPRGFTEIVEFPRDSNEILAQFITNERINDEGFYIEFSQLECGIPTPPTTAFVCPRSNGRFAHPARCDLYFECSNFRWTIKTCPRGQLINLPRSQLFDVSCERADRVSCQGRSTIFPVTTTTLRPFGFTCRLPNGQFPHGTACDRFYRCENFIWTVQLCPRGQLFRTFSTGTFAMGECADANSVSCGARTTSFPPVTPDSGNFQCPRANGLFPDSDCSKYYFCEFFRSSRLTCPVGQLFSVSSSGQDGRCLPSNQVTCGERTTKTPVAFSCPRPNGQFEHPDFCDRFYSCNNFLLDISRCPPGQLFRADDDNPLKEGRCLPSNFVNCLSRSTDLPISTTTPRTGIPFRCPAPSGVFPHESDCDKYYNCTNSIATINTCPSGQLFSIFRAGIFETGSCLAAQSTNCGSRTTAPPLPTGNPQVQFRCPQSDGIFRDSTECDIYYRCVNSVAVQRFKCPEGEIFSNLIEGEQRCFRPNAIFRNFKGAAPQLGISSAIFTTLLLSAILLT